MNLDRILDRLEVPQDKRRRVTWTAERKAKLIGMIKRKEIAFADANRLLDLSAEEFHVWCNKYATYGINGLKVNRIQTLYRGD